MTFQLLDAQAATGFVLSQTSHIEQEVNETVYPDIQYPGLIPVDTSASPFAKTVTFFSSDKFGEADWINLNSGDMPMVGTEMKKFESSIYGAGIGYGFGFEEIGQARELGRNLAADEAGAARRAYEEFVDDVALRGDTRKEMKGLIDNPLVTAANVPTGTWATATSDEMLADVNSVLMGVTAATKYTSISDTLLMSPGKLEKLSTTRLGDTTMTVLAFLQQNNVYTNQTGQPLTIRGVRGLETAGVGGKERMVGYRRHPQVLKLHMPMAHRFLPPWASSPLYVEVPGVFRLGGLDIRRPAEVRYGDGI